MTDPAPPISEEPDRRWPFVRDVLLLQVKLLIGNVHNLVLVPATTVAAILDLISKSERHGSRFYRVLEWGRQADEAIGLYDALDRHNAEMKKDFSVDSLVTQVEEAIMREYREGGTAATVKAAVDHVLDRLRGRSFGDKGSASAEKLQDGQQPR